MSASYKASDSIPNHWNNLTSFFSPGLSYSTTFLELLSFPPTLKYLLGMLPIFPVPTPVTAIRIFSTPRVACSLNTIGPRITARPSLLVLPMSWGRMGKLWTFQRYFLRIFVFMIFVSFWTLTHPFMR